MASALASSLQSSDGEARRKKTLASSLKSDQSEAELSDHTNLNCTNLLPQGESSICDSDHTNLPESWPIAPPPGSLRSIARSGRRPPPKTIAGTGSAGTNTLHATKRWEEEVAKSVGSSVGKAEPFRKKASKHHVPRVSRAEPEDMHKDNAQTQKYFGDAEARAKERAGKQKRAALEAETRAAEDRHSRWARKRLDAARVRDRHEVKVREAAMKERLAEIRLEDITEEEELHNDDAVLEDIMAARAAREATREAEWRELRARDQARAIRSFTADPGPLYRGGVQRPVGAPSVAARLRRGYAKKREKSLDEATIREILDHVSLLTGVPTRRDFETIKHLIGDRFRSSSSDTSSVSSSVRRRDDEVLGDMMRDPPPRQHFAPGEAGWTFNQDDTDDGLIARLMRGKSPESEAAADVALIESLMGRLPSDQRAALDAAIVSSLMGQLPRGGPRTQSEVDADLITGLVGSRAQSVKDADLIHDLVGSRSESVKDADLIHDLVGSRRQSVQDAEIIHDLVGSRAQSVADADIIHSLVGGRSRSPSVMDADIIHGLVGGRFPSRTQSIQDAEVIDHLMRPDLPSATQSVKDAGLIDGLMCGSRTQSVRDADIIGDLIGSSAVRSRSQSARDADLISDLMGHPKLKEDADTTGIPVDGSRLRERSQSDKDADLISSLMSTTAAVVPDPLGYSPSLGSLMMQSPQGANGTATDSAILSSIMAQSPSHLADIDRSLISALMNPPCPDEFLPRTAAEHEQAAADAQLLNQLMGEPLVACSGGVPATHEPHTTTEQDSLDDRLMAGLMGSLSAGDIGVVHGFRSWAETDVVGFGPASSLLERSGSVANLRSDADRVAHLALAGPDAEHMESVDRALRLIDQQVQPQTQSARDADLLSQLMAPVGGVQPQTQSARDANTLSQLMAPAGVLAGRLANPPGAAAHALPMASVPPLYGVKVDGAATDYPGSPCFGKSATDTQWGPPRESASSFLKRAEANSPREFSFGGPTLYTLPPGRERKAAAA